MSDNEENENNQSRPNRRLVTGTNFSKFEFHASQPPQRAVASAANHKSPQNDDDDDTQSVLTQISVASTSETMLSKRVTGTIPAAVPLKTAVGRPTTTLVPKSSFATRTATMEHPKQIKMSEIEQKRKLITIDHINPWTQEYKLSNPNAEDGEADDDDTDNVNHRETPPVYKRVENNTNFIVDWNDPVLVTDELLERLIDELLIRYTSQSHNKDIVELDKKMFVLWNLTPNDLECLQPNVLDIRIQAEWAKQQGRVLQLLFYCQKRKLAGPAVNQSERSLRNTQKFQKIMAIIDLYNTRIRSNLQLLEYSTPGSYAQSFKPSTNLVSVCLHNALFKPNSHQIVLMYILDQLRDGDYRRFGDSVYKQCYTKNNEPTHYWKEYKTITEFINFSMSRNTKIDIWNHFTKNKNETAAVAHYLKECIDPSFPALQPNRYYVTWKNGVYDIYNGIFYPHKDRILPPSVSTCQKFKFEFKFEEYIAICKRAYDADPVNHDAVKQKRADASTDEKNSDVLLLTQKVIESTNDAIKEIQKTISVGNAKAAALSSSKDTPLPAPTTTNDEIKTASSTTTTLKESVVTPAAAAVTTATATVNKYASNQRRKKINESFGSVHHKYLKYWHAVPTPLFDSILQYQELPPEVQHVVYQQIGKLFYWINQVEEWQQMMFIKGLPGTGKSSLLNIVSAFYRKKDLAKISAGLEEKFGLGPFVGRYILMCSEVKKRMGIDQTMFQNMVEGETTTFNIKHKDAKEATWDTPVIFAGNENPDWTEFGGNIGRRMLLVMMERKVRSQDMDLQYKIVNNELAALQFKFNCAYRMKVVECGSDNIWKHLPTYFTNTRKRVTGEMNPLMMFFTESGKVRLQSDMNSTLFKANNTTLSSATNATNATNAKPSQDEKETSKSTASVVMSGGDEVYFEKNEDGQFIISEEDFLHLYSEFCEMNQYKRTRWNADFYQGIFDDVGVRRHKARYMYKDAKRDNTYLIGVAEVKYRSARINLVP